MRREENAAVDFGKLFCCICILFLHTGAYHEVYYGERIKMLLLNWTVQFFFIVSGFFVGKKIVEKFELLKESVLLYVRRLLYPYIGFLALNSMFLAYDLYKQGESFK